MIMEEESCLIDIDYFKKTGQPGHGIIEVPSWTSSSDEDEGKGGSDDNPADTRNKGEKLMFCFVEEGNVEGIREVMRRYGPEIRVNAENGDGWTMLMVAVDGGDLQVMLAVLMDIDRWRVDLSGGLKMAVEENKVDCLRLILEFDEERRCGGKRRKAKRRRKEAMERLAHQGELDTEPTPLMIAAIKGNVEVLDVLWERGERMPNLHYASCACRICVNRGREVEKSEKRVKLLEAMGHGAWLTWMVDKEEDWNPVEEAIKVCEMAKRCQDEEPEWSRQYERVKQETEQNLIEMVRGCTSERQIAMLLQGNTLKGAAHSELKVFLGEPAVQFYLRQQWTILKSSYFYARLIGYFIFLALLTVLGSGDVTIGNNNVDRQTHWLRWTLLIFVTSYVLDLCFEVNQSPKYFWNSGWNQTEVATCALLLITFYIWFLEEIMSWRDVTNLLFSRPSPNTTIGSPVFSFIGHLSFYSANLLAILSLFQFTILLPFFGPLQAKLWCLVVGKWKAIVLCLLFTIIPVFLVRLRYSQQAWWNPWALFTLTVSCAFAFTFFQVAAIGFFCNARKINYPNHSCAKTAGHEVRYQTAVAMIRQLAKLERLPPPINLLSCFNCPNDTKQTFKQRSRSKLMQTLYKRMLRKK